MNSPNTAPATKEDVRFLMEKIAEVLDGQDGLKRHLDVTVEIIRSDLTGANADEIETLKQDVNRIKKFVRMPAA